MRSRRRALQASDIVVLASSLSALLERVPARSVRVVVFNLDQQRELLRRDPFADGDVDHVIEALSEVQLATVNYEVLRNAGGGVALLAGLVLVALGALAVSRTRAVSSLVTG